MTRRRRPHARAVICALIKAFQVEHGENVRHAQLRQAFESSWVGHGKSFSFFSNTLDGMIKEGLVTRRKGKKRNALGSVILLTEDGQSFYKENKVLAEPRSASYAIRLSAGLVKRDETQRCEQDTEGGV